MAHLNNTDVSLTIDILDADGNILAFTPTSIHYTVVDEEGVTLVPETNIVGYIGEPSVVVSVGSAFNIVPLGKTRAIRLITLNCVSGSDSANVEFSYIIETANQLEVGINSYQTFQNAELLASEMSNLEGWDSANRQQKVSAMIEARENLSKLSLHPYRVGYIDMTHAIAPYSQESVFTYGSELFTSAYLLSLPEAFVTSLRKAQIAEANFILSDGSTEHKERDGLSSEKIGETAQSFRASKPLQYSVCKRAITYLRAYLTHSKKLARG